MPKTEFKYLDWDSKFFGKKIYKLDILRLIGKTEFHNLIKGIDGDLIYVFSKFILDSELSEKLFLVDKKVVYRKKIKHIAKNNPSEYDIVSSDMMSKNLLEMAILSGQHSRFKLDKRLNHKFHDLYRIWLEASLERRLATQVLVCKINDEEVGFVTFKANEGVVSIGLIAVKSLLHGKNIGTALVQEVEKWCQINDKSFIEVATQLENKQACRFYEKNGFTIKQVDYIYHYYKK